MSVIPPESKQESYWSRNFGKKNSLQDLYYDLTVPPPPFTQYDIINNLPIVTDDTIKNPSSTRFMCQLTNTSIFMWLGVLGLVCIALFYVIFLLDPSTIPFTGVSTIYALLIFSIIMVIIHLFVKRYCYPDKI